MSSFSSNVITFGSGNTLTLATGATTNGLAGFTFVTVSQASIDALG